MFAYLIEDTVLIDKLIDTEFVPDNYIKSSKEYDGTCTRYIDGKFVEITPTDPNQV